MAGRRFHIYTVILVFADAADYDGKPTCDDFNFFKSKLTH